MCKINEIVISTTKKKAWQGKGIVSDLMWHGVDQCCFRVGIWEGGCLGKKSSAEGQVRTVPGGRRVQGLHFSTLLRSTFLFRFICRGYKSRLIPLPCHRPQMQGEIYLYSLILSWIPLVPRSSGDAEPGRRARGHPVSLPTPSRL